MDLQEQFTAYKKAILEREFSNLNPMQREAVFTVRGPLLILAGAGSGKTTVLINRVLNLIRFGNSYQEDFLPAGFGEADLDYLRGAAEGREAADGRLDALLARYPAKPWNILAITFTNKAAGELRERLAKRLGEPARDIQAATFHSACTRILRKNIDRLGYKSDFAIYDTDDSLRVVKRQMNAMNLSERNIKPRSLLSAISRAKDRMLSPEEMLREAGDEFLESTAAKVYSGYQKDLKDSNALDFDDIILLTVRLFEKNPDVLEFYQKRFRYIMVDEYQDTNLLQYRLVSMLAQAHQNLCVVGDDDQSIYKFRGATIENILQFEDQFPGAKVVRLEQNYRSTKTILNAANAVIENNLERKGKNLWTENPQGPQITVTRMLDEQGEAAAICKKIGQNVRDGAHFADHAVLYRMNAQSGSVEREMTRSGIPYKIIGGLRFFERKEIKDAVAYLSVINNPADNLRLARILNEPKRGIGDTSIAYAQEIAEGLGVPLLEVLRTADAYPALSRRAVVMIQFAGLMDKLIQEAESGMPLDLLYETVLEKSGYLPFLIAQGESELTRVENLEELKSNITRYMEESPEPTLSGFLEEIALYTDIDSYNESDDRVILMTVHSAKGLEFDHVFLAGAEEGIFPGARSAYSQKDLEEERRLAYVAFTRARKTLEITCCAQRLLFGSTARNPVSRFVTEIPKEYVLFEDAESQRRAAHTAKPRERAGAAAKSPARKTGPASGGIGGAVLPRSSLPPLQTGDLVEHPIFGTGVVRSAKPMAGDTLLEIEFESAGMKKVMQNYANLKKA